MHSKKCEIKSHLIMNHKMEQQLTFDHISSFSPSLSLSLKINCRYNSKVIPKLLAPLPRSASKSADYVNLGIYTNRAQRATQNTIIHGKPKITVLKLVVLIIFNISEDYI